MSMLPILLTIIIVAVLAYFGRKLLVYKPSHDLEKNKDNVDIFEELRDLKSIKINRVPSQEIYSYFFGLLLTAIACYFAVSFVSYAISCIGIDLGSISLWMALGYISFVSLFYTGILFNYLWSYVYFKKAIAPNLKYGKLILVRIHDLAKKVFGLVIAIILLGGVFDIVFLISDRPIGPTLALFIGCGVLLVAINVAVGLELSRAGLPNLIEGLQNLVKTQKESE